MRLSQVFEPYYSSEKGTHTVVFPQPFVPKHQWEKLSYKSEQDAKQALWVFTEFYYNGHLPWQVNCA